MADFPFPRLLGILLALAVIGPLLSGCNQSSAFMMNESGKSLYSQGQYTAARREFERALMDNPQNTDYAFNVASAMRKQGDLIGAERMYRHALTIDPRHQPAHHGLAAMLVDQGRVAEADSHLREWAETQPQLAEAHIENAWLRRDLGDMPAAEQALHRALQTDPRNPVALAQLGDLYEMNGRPGEAHALYQQSLARNPFQSEIKARMGEARSGWQSTPGVAMAAYPPNGQWPMPPMQQASYSAAPAAYPVPSNGMTPLAAPFRGFASTPGPNPGVASYGQQVQGAGYPQPTAAPAWPAATPPTYGNPAMSAPYGNAYPTTNADPAHVPLTMSAVPVVTPF